jgi:hypothetical protein
LTVTNGSALRLRLTDDEPPQTHHLARPFWIGPGAAGIAPDSMGSLHISIDGA